jgi:hypothetical protein
LRAIGVPGLTLELLAWEATHLARRSLLGTQGEHAMWLVDGLGSNVGRASARQLLAPANEPVPADWPTRDTAVVRVQQLAKTQKLPPASAILADRIDDLDMRDRYAARAVFFEMLREPGHEKALAKVFASVRSTGGGKDYQERVLASARTAFGKGLDADFQTYVAGCRAQWSETFRSLVPFEGGFQQIAFPAVNAIAWHQQPVAGGAVRIAGQVRILPGDGRQMNVLFGRTDAADFCSVALVADQGFTAFAYRSKSDEWQRLGGGNAPSLRLGYTSDFEITAQGDALHVELDGSTGTSCCPRSCRARCSGGSARKRAWKGRRRGRRGCGPR